MTLITRWAAIAAVAVLACGAPALAAPYTVSYLDGGNWNTIFAQGFNTALGATPNPGFSNGDPVTLARFEFFKSGTQDAASDIRLAIIDSMYPGSPTVDAMTSTSPTVLGLSTNTIASTAGLLEGDSIAFEFANLPLTYGTDYAAVMVNVGTDVGSGAPLTPVLVSALTANYVEVNPGDFHPETNYGTEGEFQYTTSNFINGGFFSAFTYAGDARFRATFNVPEPTALALTLLGGTVCVAMRRRGSR
jgi:hypothetical protein